MAKIESWGDYGHVVVELTVTVDGKIVPDWKLPDHTVDDIHRRLFYHLETIDPKAIEARAKRKERIIAAFGDRKIHVKEIENQYDANSPEPWYGIVSERGYFIVGVRKRVFSIDWQYSDTKETAEQLFPKSANTKYGHTIHAYIGTGQLEEYIKRLHDDGKSSNDPVS